MRLSLLNSRLGVCAIALLALIAALPATAVRRPNMGGTIIVGVHTLPLSVDPALAHDRVSLLIAGAVHAGLYRLSESDRPTLNLLADAPKRSNSGKRWHCQLRRGLRFHNGKSIRSNDFRYSLERLKNTPHRWLQHLLKVTILNDRRFVIDLAHPLSRSELGRLLATPALSILSANDSVAVGAGSFRVARRRSRSLRLNAVIDHIDGRPYVDAVEFRKVGNGDEAFKYRKVDLVLTPSSRFKASTHLRGSFSETVGLLFHRKFMDRDRGMRARFWSAIVRKEFTTRVAGEVRAAHGLHPDGRSFKPAGRHSTKQPIEGVLMCLESERRLALELAAGVATKGHRLTVLPVSAKSYALAQQGKGALHWDLMLVGYVHQDLSKDTAYNTLAQMVALEPGKDALLELKQQLLWIPIVDRAFSAVVVPALRGLVFTKDGSLHFESAYWAKP